jgi:hypothetical protein
MALKRLDALYALNRPDLKDPPFVPAAPAPLDASQDGDLFGLIRQRDTLLHHPFDSFQPVVELLKNAARGPSFSCMLDFPFDEPFQRRPKIHRRHSRQTKTWLPMPATF